VGTQWQWRWSGKLEKGFPEIRALQSGITRLGSRITFPCDGRHRSFPYPPSIVNLNVLQSAVRSSLVEMIGLGDWSRRLIEMIDQIDWSRCIRFSIPVGLRTEEYVVKPTGSVASHIDVNHAVCHFEVPQGGDVVFEREQRRPR
jgi:hypothetical protein